MRGCAKGVTQVGWESRSGSSRLYYTRTRRVGRRVVRQYIGGGIAGEMAAMADEADREEREAKAAAYRAQRERDRSLDAQLDVLAEQARALTAATLLCAGYHKHHGSEWRRRRDG